MKQVVAKWCALTAGGSIKQGLLVLVHFGALKITKLAQIKTANFDAFAFMMMLGMRVFGQIRLKWQQSEHKPE